MTCVVITALIGLILGGRVIGIGVGTIVTMLAVGRILWLVNKLFRDKLLAVAGLTEGETETLAEGQ
ncbi:MAG: hypothetical protein EOM54_13635 [Clostridia bacterium]|nr:hypothetical protein [Clostridia bacterium]